MRNYLLHSLAFFVWIGYLAFPPNPVIVRGHYGELNPERKGAYHGPGDNPVFSSEPADTTVNCLDDAPAPVALTATDDNDPSFPKQVTPVDSPNPASIDPCQGGIITRTWTVSDFDGNTTIVEQLITVKPDLQGPVVSLQEVHDTVACGEADFVNWLNTMRLRLSFPGNGVADACGSLISIDYSPKNLPANMGACETRLITFTLEDQCGNQTIWHASYTTIDDEEPVLGNVPRSLSLSCRDEVPDPPTVTAVDNCDTSVDVQYEESVEPSADCPSFNMTITRKWSATDDCGNTTVRQQIITVRDEEEPTFTAPANKTLTCGQDPNNLDITGRVTDLFDACNEQPSITFSDKVLRQDCPNSYVIQRTWLASDVCGNVAIRTQMIEVVDNEAPTFTVPADATVSCDQANDLNVTGRPKQVADNCDPAPNVRIREEVVVTGNCPNRYEVRRIWRVEDICGNATEKTQKIFVTDGRAPVFSQPAADLSIQCQPGADVSKAFNDWIGSHGGATADDNCSLRGELVWKAFNAGTTAPATLPGEDCRVAGQGVVRRRMVDFIVEDECGNRDTSTAAFSLIDQAPPVIRNCPQEIIVPVDPSSCAGTVSLRIPQVEENCSSGSRQGSLSAQAPIVSKAAPGQEGEVPVDPVTLTFSTSARLPLTVTGDVTLIIRLRNADAEEANEFFNILGEDNSTLGKTAAANQQCGNSETTLSLSRSQFEAWAADGALTLRLQPNIPAGQPGRFAINALCNPTGSVEAELRFEQRDLSGIEFRYRIGDGPGVLMNANEASEVSLPQGVHLVTYFATDCAGNTDSCTFFVRVVDREPPVLNCPADISVKADAGKCTASVTLPLPAGLTDNCLAGARYSQIAPASETEARLVFRYDPNLNDYLADDKTLTFNGVAANATGPATFTLDFLGDFNSRGAFVRIVGEDNNVLGQTQVGAATCATAGQLVITLPRATFNAWASDGKIELRAQTNDIQVPPGIKGDGINPCDAAAVNADGQNDGKSYLRGKLEYEYIRPSYYATGATALPLTPMPVPAATPTHAFQAGVTTVYYLLSDAAGNTDTCSFRVTVRDEEAPVARCSPTTVFINPAGTGEETIAASVIDGGSGDNCGIDTMFITPGTFTCSQAGTTTQVTLTVIDGAGNRNTCTTPVRIETLKPEPTATSGVCGNDTLYLFANPPRANGGVVFTYRWTGPKGFVSDKQNPVIPKVTADNAGSYQVEITGITGCKSTGTVEVAIESLPLTPQLVTDRDICVNEDITLGSSVVPSGSSVIYRWYRGIPPGGALLGTTQVPVFTIPAPHSEGTNSYYLTVESAGCLSAASAPVPVRITQVPQALVSQSNITVCEGSAIALGTPVSGAGVVYQWTGPNGFSSTNQFPPVIDRAVAANGGVYKLIITRNGCASAEGSVIVNVLPKPAQPQLSNSGPVCEGRELVLTTNISKASVYRWVSPTLQEFSTTTDRLVISSASQESAGAWRLTVSQFGCTSDPSAPSEVVVNTNPPTAAAASQNIICEGDKLQLSASPTIANAIYRWTGPANFSSASQNPAISNITKDREGTYQVVVTTAQGCTGSASVTVAVQRRAAITAISNDGPDCLSGPTDIHLVASVFPVDPGNYRYRWMGPNGFTSSDSVAVIRNATEANNGNYQLVVTTGDGCVSDPSSTTVSVANPAASPALPRVSEQTPAPFCEGRTIQLLTENYNGVGVVYNWRTPKGIIATTAPVLDIPAARAEDSGDYSVFVTLNGCDSRESGKLNLTVSKTPVVSISTNSPVCEGQSIQLRTQVLPGVTYTWTGPGYTSTLPNPNIEGASPGQNNGTYSLRANLNGCVSNLVTAEVRVIPAPPLPVAMNSGPVCTSLPGAELRLFVDERSAAPGATYTWSDPNGVIVRDTTALSIRLSGLTRYGNGTTVFIVRAKQNGCNSLSAGQTAAQLNIIPTSQAFAGNDFTACEGFSTELKASNPSLGSGFWTLVQGDSAGVVVANPDLAVTAVNGLKGGASYTFRWTLSNGACKNYSSDEVSLNVTETEVVDGGDDIMTCESEEVILDASPVSTSRAFWSQTPVQELLGVRIESPNKAQTRITGLEGGNLYSFTWTVVGGCGEITDEVFVLVSDPNPFAGLDKEICNDEGIVQLEADEPTEGSRGRWSSLQPGPGFSDPRRPDAIASGLTPGKNTFIWTIDNGICGDDSRDTVVINFKVNPVARPDTVRAQFGKETEFFPVENDSLTPGTTITITRQPERGQIRQLEDGKFVYLSRADFVGTERMTYQLCSTSCECSETTVTFLLGEDIQCNIPTIFTPNNDGVNDMFVIPCLLDTDQYPNSQVMVFNRWGDEVFRSQKPYQNDWRGTFNGEDLPAGTYFYIVDLGDGSDPLDGFIVIQR